MQWCNAKSSIINRDNACSFAEDFLKGEALWGKTARLKKKKIGGKKKKKRLYELKRTSDYKNVSSQPPAEK